MTVANPVPDLQGASIVLRGSFNPAIFHPKWFEINELFSRDEADAAAIEIVHQEATVFSTEWLTLNVFGDNFVAKTQDATKFLPLRDIVIGTFSILEHTPLNALGLNTNKHFQVNSVQDRDAFGFCFASEQPWDALINYPKVRSLTMSGNAAEISATQVNLKFEPSVRVNPGVYVQVNAHYAGNDESEVPSGAVSTFLSLIKDEWSNFLGYSEKVSATLFSEFKMSGTKR